MYKVLILWLIVLLPKLSPADQSFFRDEKEKIHWILKVTSKLRNLQGASAVELEKFKKMSESDVVNELTKDSRFADTILRFNLYFLGDEPNALKLPNGEYAQQAFYHPSAITSARAILLGGDYLSLFSPQQPIYVGWPLVPPPVSEHPELSIEQRRQRAFQVYADDIQHLLKIVKTNLQLTFTEFCKNHFAKRTQEVDFLRDSAISEPLGTAFWLGEGGARAIGSACAAETPAPDLEKQLERILQNLDKLIALTDTLHQKKYPMKSVSDIRQVNAKELGIENTAHFLTYKGFWKPFPNTSTNMNRKRAAEVLKTFFCDDLTPINGEGGENPPVIHGSNSSCTACHYKLDPMAGFFRYRGLDGISFEKGTWIVFDQGGVVSRSIYEDNWKGEASSVLSWNIGYIRSLQFLDKNDYGESIEDFFSIIQNAPEVKACLVKKMSRFILGENQIVDGSFLNYLTTEFVTHSNQNSVVAIKELVKRLVLSKSFTANDPNPNVCYDFAPGTSLASRPPCKIASLIEKNCVGCHTAQNKLDFSKWLLLPSGEYGFLHNGFSPQDSWKIIHIRLSTSDLKVKMPLGKYMPQTERAELLEWVEKQINKEVFQ